jgi:hypothetical protein
LSDELFQGRLGLNFSWPLKREDFIFFQRCILVCAPCAKEPSDAGEAVCILEPGSSSKAEPARVAPVGSNSNSCLRQDGFTGPFKLVDKVEARTDAKQPPLK